MKGLNVLRGPTRTAVALLRGVNVGGKHKLPMAELRVLLEQLGCRGVRTYIQSGNAIFETPAATMPGLPAAIQAAVLERFGFESPVVLRTAVQIRAAMKSNPFLAAGADPKHLHVGFLSAKPAADLVRSLDPRRSPGDAFVVVGGEVYLHVPGGLARTKLTNAYFDAALKTVCTVRNWHTVQILHDLAWGPKA